MQPSVSKLSFWFVLCLLGLLGCGDSSADDPGAALEIDDGASQGVSTSKVVTPGAAATLELPTGAKLAIPAGAVSKEVEISMKRPSDKEAFTLVKSLPPGQKLASAPYVLTPHGIEFQADVKLSLPVSKDSDPSKLAVMWLKDEGNQAWKMLGTPQVSEKQASVNLKHFSVLVLVEQTASAQMGLDAGRPGRDSGSEDPVGSKDAGPTVGQDASAQLDSDAGDVQPPTSPDGGSMAVRDAGTGSDLDASAADVCGDGVMGPSEYCDLGIPSGSGSCPTAGYCQSLSTACLLVFVANQGTCQQVCVQTPVSCDAGLPLSDASALPVADASLPI